MSVEGVLGISLGVVGLAFSSHYLWRNHVPRKRLSWRDIKKALLRIRNAMGNDGYTPTVIVGIGRGGAVCGALLSGLLKNRPLIVIDRTYVWQDGDRQDSLICHVQFPKKLIKRVLLIAGEVHTGKTLVMYRNYFNSLGAEEIRIASPYVQSGHTIHVHFPGIETPNDIMLPWMLDKNYSRESRSIDEAQKGKSSVSELSEAKQCKSTSHLYFIRHGQAEYNADGDRFCGITDSELTETGVLQAKAVGAWLLSKPLSCIIASPLLRAKETGHIISKITGAPLIVDPRLREMDFGDWEGKTKPELQLLAPQSLMAWFDNPVEAAPPNSEPPSMVVERMMDFLDSHACSCTNPATAGDVAVVTSSTSLRLLLTELAGKPLSTYRNLKVQNASITTIAVEERGKFDIQNLNNTEHLR